MDSLNSWKLWKAPSPDSSLLDNETWIIGVELIGHQAFLADVYPTLTVTQVNLSSPVIYGYGDLTQTSTDDGLRFTVNVSAELLPNQTYEAVWDFIPLWIDSVEMSGEFTRYVPLEVEEEEDDDDTHSTDPIDDPDPIDGGDSNSTNPEIPPDDQTNDTMDDSGLENTEDAEDLHDAIVDLIDGGSSTENATTNSTNNSTTENPPPPIRNTTANEALLKIGVPTVSAAGVGGSSIFITTVRKKLKLVFPKFFARFTRKTDLNF